MSGNSVQIFSILITVMLFVNSIKAALSVNQTFERFESGTRSTASGFAGLLSAGSSPLFLPKLVFVGLQLANVGLGVWKCAGMGLLPTANSDWLAFLEPKTVTEIAYGNVLSL